MSKKLIKTLSTILCMAILFTSSHSNYQISENTIQPLDYIWETDNS